MGVVPTVLNSQAEFTGVREGGGSWWGINGLAETNCKRRNLSGNSGPSLSSSSSGDEACLRGHHEHR